MQAGGFQLGRRPFSSAWKGASEKVYQRQRALVIFVFIIWREDYVHQDVVLSFRFVSQDICVHLVALLSRLFFFALYFSLLEGLFMFPSQENVNFVLEGLSDLFCFSE